MQKMGLMAIYQKPNTSKPHPAHEIYPHRLFPTFPSLKLRSEPLCNS
jgi:hypothetical protein